MPASFVNDVVKWLQDVRGELDVLIHPEIDDDLLAHAKQHGGWEIRTNLDSNDSNRVNAQLKSLGWQCAI